jgi:hypothetical protein
MPSRYPVLRTNYRRCETLSEANSPSLSALAAHPPNDSPAQVESRESAQAFEAITSVWLALSGALGWSEKFSGGKKPLPKRK